MAEQITVARPYAQAVFELAKAEDDLQGWSEMLALLTAIVSVREVWEVIHSPRLTRSQVAELIIEAGGGRFSAEFRNFIRLLAENRRLNVVPEIGVLYEQLRAEAESRVKAEVIAAQELSDEQKQKIADSLRKRLGREVELSCTVDASLLGGAVIRAGDLVIDGSARGKLEKLAAALAS
ncbi:MAG: F0F1 ATP synthase subunit delta [Gammaproteobacteria bacterium]